MLQPKLANALLIILLAIPFPALFCDMYLNLLLLRMNRQQRLKVSPLVSIGRALHCLLYTSRCV